MAKDKIPIVGGLLAVGAGLLLLLTGKKPEKPSPPTPGEPATLWGTVSNSQTGQPIPQAAVSLTPLAGTPASVETDSLGEYHFPDLLSGDYVLAITGIGYDYVTTTIGLQPGDNQYNAQLVPEGFVDWQAFGQCLNNFSEYLADGVGLALCMRDSGAVIGYSSGGNELRTCGLQNPQYLTVFAREIVSPVTVNMSESDLAARFGLDCRVMPIGYTWSDATANYQATLVAEYLGTCYATVRVTYKITNWERAPHQSMVNYCAYAL